ncbi:MAG TPA: hypothetical protein VN881_06835 [Candidatus Acidoferrales bacterium]|nr:hypothetical protein [Candidatus Acidoferrales bacterium]
MLLAVAVVFIGFQVAQPILPVLVSPSVASASAPGETTDTKLAVPMMNPTISSAKDSKAPEESSSTSSGAARLKMDSIYANDKGPQPGAATVTVAQNSQSFSTIRIREQNEKGHATREAESVPLRREWLTLMVLEHGAAAFDAYSTRDAISRGAKEEDPLMRPFAHSPAIYAAIQVGPVLLDVLARHMQRSQYNFERRTWWVPQSVSTGVSIFSGVHNLRVVGHP